MLATKIRKQGGAAVVTLPAEVLRQLDAGIGEDLSIVVSQHTIILRPARSERRRYNLEELLAGRTCRSSLRTPLGPGKVRPSGGS